MKEGKRERLEVREKVGGRGWMGLQHAASRLAVSPTPPTPNSSAAWAREGHASSAEPAPSTNNLNPRYRLLA